MSIDMEAIMQDIARLRAEGLISPKTPPNYGWPMAMSGEGAPVPDAQVWKHRYELVNEENRNLKQELADVVLLVHRLKTRIRNMGGQV